MDKFFAKNSVAIVAGVLVLLAGSAFKAPGMGVMVRPFEVVIKAGAIALLLTLLVSWFGPKK